MGKNSNFESSLQSLKYLEDRRQASVMGLLKMAQEIEELWAVPGFGQIELPRPKCHFKPSMQAYPQAVASLWT